MNETPEEDADTVTHSSSPEVLREFAPLPYQSLNSDGEILAVNDAWLDILGYEQDEVEGKWFGEILANDSVDDFKSRFPEFKSNGGGTNVEFEMQCADGEIILVSFDGTVEYDEAGSFVRAHCQFKEITEQKERAEKYFESAGNIMLVLNRDGTVANINERGCNLLGYDRSELIGSDWFDLVVPESIDGEIWDVFSTFLNEDEDAIKKHTNFIETKAGEKVFIKWQNTALRDRSGTITAVLSSGIDITERKAQLRELETKTGRLNLALEAADLGMWDWDMKNDDVYRDERWAAMLGYEPEEIEDRFEAWEDLVHPKDRERHDEALAAHMGDEAEYYSSEYRLRTKSGEWKWVMNIGKIVEWDGDSPKRSVGVHLDIDDRKRTRQRLKRNNELLRAFDQVLRHNMNTAMTVIRGYAETIVETWDGNVADQAAKIRESSDTLLTTIDKERRITKLINESKAPEKLAVDQLLQRVADRVRDEYPRTNIDVRGERNVTIRAVQSAEEAIEELVENAIIHTEDMHPQVTITVQSKPDTVSITVADNGPGIPEMDKNVLTKESDITPLYHGSGLGLWFVKEVAHRSEAEISVTDNQPRGTKITMRFMSA